MEKQIVHLFVFNTLADWETRYTVAGINNPDMQKQHGRYQIQPVGLTAEPITTIFAYHIFKKLDLYELPVLEAWYGLFKTGDASYYFTLEQLTT
ncbi:hypothetical protein K9N68_21860 [Kovacikia minuta CCNUW1]|uniref:hypothetical protein n=1 Tax=Kovacikia minuta TaxID=2931930 RepID=UPI001CCD9C69|nr:hypothetical protein [Kovacikia minuta]UBF24337.1 hypothetical protein K9N68_21860 [Kovacikia minuta CCNUW1]